MSGAGAQRNAARMLRNKTSLSQLVSHFLVRLPYTFPWRRSKSSIGRLASQRRPKCPDPNTVKDIVSVRVTSFWGEH
jgi:hypothetical protein